MRRTCPFVYMAALVCATVLLASCGRLQGPSADKVSGEEHVKYYTCGMHPTVHVSPEEYRDGSTKCPICGMSLVAVMAGGGQERPLGPDAGVVALTVPREQLLRADVRTETLARRKLCKNIRAAGNVAYDPDMAIAQEELISGIESMEKMSGGGDPEIRDRTQRMVDASRKKLRLLGLSDEQIDGISETGKIQEGLVLPDKKMWVYGDIYEYEISWVPVGGKVTVTSESYPGKMFSGVISAIDPVIDPATRSVRFRAEIDNPELELKPEMYVNVDIEGTCLVSSDGKTLALPKEALLDTGTRKIVWVMTGPGKFEGRKVEVGAIGTSKDEGGDREFYPVISGLSEGEEVVTKGNFLIDSQSQITGVASSAYGGSLGPKTKETAHQH
ncbi:MAG: efflux RND transporter periplasmic adaptor subunit [Candidatus Omnitrophica bacterium]|nr:efflux RND transporter periplasmic adaptor subunit [Candidatus Omnitrophota bacterium]MDD5488608.1 efflux RND transporter periplasmic adaptor subunit [Candidatus Omnitrophota bacterium]